MQNFLFAPLSFPSTTLLTIPYRAGKDDGVGPLRKIHQFEHYTVVVVVLSVSSIFNFYSTFNVDHYS